MREFDVVVVGGGPAGLTAAVTLARARRSVVVVDDGRPRNAGAHAVHGLLSRDGMPASQLLAEGRREVSHHGGEVLDAEAVAVVRRGGAFEVATDDDVRLRARHVVVASGLVDALPDVPGLGERWARDVLHCPYCHGREHTDRRLGVLATGTTAVDEALLLRQWSADVALLTHTAGAPSDEERFALDARAVSVVEGEVVGLAVGEDALTGACLGDGRTVPLDALFVAPRLEARAGLLERLGVAPLPHSVGDAAAADPCGRTSVPGLWAVGNVVDLAAQVVVAASEGLRCAVAINSELVEADVTAAVRAYAADPPRAATRAVAATPRRSAG